MPFERTTSTDANASAFDEYKCTVPRQLHCTVIEIMIDQVSNERPTGSHNAPFGLGRHLEVRSEKIKLEML